MHRLAPAVQAAIMREFCQLGGGLSLIFKIHGQIWIIPIALNPQALEFIALNGHELGGIFAAKFAHFQLGYLVLF